MILIPRERHQVTSSDCTFKFVYAAVVMSHIVPCLCKRIKCPPVEFSTRLTVVDCDIGSSKSLAILLFIYRIRLVCLYSFNGYRSPICFFFLSQPVANVYKGTFDCLEPNFENVEL